MTRTYKRCRVLQLATLWGAKARYSNSTLHTLLHTRLCPLLVDGTPHQVQAINVRHASQYKVAVQLVRAMRAHPSDTRVACQGALALASLVRPSLQSMGVISADPRLLAAAKRGAASTGLDLSGAGLLDASHRKGVQDAGGIPALTWSMAACDQFPDVVTMLCIAMRQLASTSPGMITVQEAGSRCRLHSYTPTTHTIDQPCAKQCSMHKPYSAS